MNSLFFGICIIGVGGGIFMLHFLIMILRKWLDTQWLKLHGLETSARILEAQVINEAGRYLPFVRLKIEINTLKDGWLQIKNNIQKKIGEQSDTTGIENIRNKFRLLCQACIRIADQEETRTIEVPLMNLAETVTV